MKNIPSPLCKPTGQLLLGLPRSEKWVACSGFAVCEPMGPMLALASVLSEIKSGLRVVTMSYNILQ